MDAYTEEMVLALREPILANFHPPTDHKPSWHIRPDEMARAVLDAVAPAIAARALRDAAEFWASFPDEVDDETPADIRNWLRDRADEIESSAT